MSVRTFIVVSEIGTALTALGAHVERKRESVCMREEAILLSTLSQPSIVKHFINPGPSDRSHDPHREGRGFGSGGDRAANHEVIRAAGGLFGCDLDNGAARVSQSFMAGVETVWC